MRVGARYGDGEHVVDDADRAVDRPVLPLQADLPHAAVEKLAARERRRVARRVDAAHGEHRRRGGNGVLPDAGCRCQVEGVAGGARRSPTGVEVDSGDGDRTGVVRISHHVD